MHPAVKVLVGALMVVIGVFSTWTFLDQITVLVKGAIGPLLVLLGAFIVWLESDEWKMRREEKKSEGTGFQQSLQEQAETAVSAEEVQDQVDEDEEEDEDVEEVSEAEDEKVACPECGKEFDTERGMKIHQAQKH
ncbi:MAG: hypothetical protein ABEK01_00765 [Candidatus Nanohaloarchaea archaeon]